MGKYKTSRTRSGSRRARRARQPRDHAGPAWLYGRHAVLGALANPARRCRRVLVTAEASPDLHDRLARLAREREDPPPVETVARRDIEARLPRDAVHQGVALEAEPLGDMPLEWLCSATSEDAAALIVALDRVSDPRNVGAVLRAAAAFGARAVVVTERHAPSTTGALAKAAAGALDRIPLVRVTNLARALGALKAAGFWCAGLDANAETDLDRADLPRRLVLVLGAEGTGLRRLSRARCDYLLRIPMAPGIESLNVATAAAIALYALSTRD